MATRVNVGLLGAGGIGRVQAGNLAYRIPAANLVEATAHVGLRAFDMNVLSPYFEVESFSTR